MIKIVIKEIIIVLLILLAIILAIGVLFYDYIPSNKIIPIVEAYQTPKEVKEELEETLIKESEKVLVTYEITEADLRQYEKQGDYEKGKANPFSEYKQIVSSSNKPVTDSNSSDKTSSSENTSTKKENTNSSTFYNSTGTK